MPNIITGYVVPLLGLAFSGAAGRIGQLPRLPAESGLPSSSARACFFLFLPFHVILEANPEWRLIYWLNGFSSHRAGWLSPLLPGWLELGPVFRPPASVYAYCGSLAHVVGNRRHPRPDAFSKPAGRSKWADVDIPAVQHGRSSRWASELWGSMKRAAACAPLQSALMLPCFWAKCIGSPGSGVPRCSSLRSCLCCWPISPHFFPGLGRSQSRHASDGGLARHRRDCGDADRASRPDGWLIS